MGANEKKRHQLGMPLGTARNRLVKALLFKFIQETGKNECFQCGETISKVEHLSIEHKEAWMDSTDPVDLYFDLDNVAFSHQSCNSSSARQPVGISGFRGVIHDPRERRNAHWKVQVWDGHCFRSGGYFVDPRDAAEAYDREAKKILGEKAITNKSLGLL